MSGKKVREVKKLHLQCIPVHKGLIVICDNFYQSVFLMQICKRSVRDTLIRRPVIFCYPLFMWKY